MKVRLSTRGRFVIPVQIDRELGLQPRTTIAVEDDGNGSVLKPQKTSSRRNASNRKS
jgi:bifunctional DNA-binding transcriptional regulator/antitoxin component of YhaV-PrlF toxin-antitoxin module